MPAEETTAAHYHRLAQECRDVAATFRDGDKRDALLEMAQVWQRLADQYANATPLVFQPDAGEQPVMQQQQQVQKDEDKS